MLSYTTCTPRKLYSKGCPHGAIDKLLTYITHAMFEFIGMEVLPSFGLFGPMAMKDEKINRKIQKKYLILYKNIIKQIKKGDWIAWTKNQLLK